MKIRVLYEDDIKNGHKSYTTIEIPDGDYTLMLDIDYEQRLAEAKPEKKDEVKRCETVQEVFDLMNKKEYNNWRKFNRHWGYSKAKPNEEGEEIDTSEPLMKEVADDRVFRKDEISRDCENEYQDVCQWIRKTLLKKPEWADAFIAVRIDGIPIREYANSIGADENNITQKLKRATKKLQKEYKNRQI
jgi:hypothetical protein